MAAVQIKGRVPETTAALFDLAVDVMAQTAQVVRRHRGGVTRTVAFTQNAAVIAALTEWSEAVLAEHPELAQSLAAERMADPEADPERCRALELALRDAGFLRSAHSAGNPDTSGG
jgi:hypothetical protein